MVICCLPVASACCSYAQVQGTRQDDIASRTSWLLKTVKAPDPRPAISKLPGDKQFADAIKKLEFARHKGCTQLGYRTLATNGPDYYMAGNDSPCAVAGEIVPVGGLQKPAYKTLRTRAGVLSIELHAGTEGKESYDLAIMNDATFHPMGREDAVPGMRTLLFGEPLEATLNRLPFVATKYGKTRIYSLDQRRKMSPSERNAVRSPSDAPGILDDGAVRVVTDANGARIIKIEWLFPGSGSLVQEVISPSGYRLIQSRHLPSRITRVTFARNGRTTETKTYTLKAATFGRQVSEKLFTEPYTNETEVTDVRFGSPAVTYHCKGAFVADEKVKDVYLKEKGKQDAYNRYQAREKMLRVLQLVATLAVTGGLVALIVVLRRRWRM